MSKKKVLLRGVFINRDTNGEGVLKVGTTLIRVSTVMGILYKTTKVYDNLAEDAMGNWCEVDTKELRQLIDEWCDKVQKFKMSITTKPPTGRLNS